MKVTALGAFSWGADLLGYRKSILDAVIGTRVLTIYNSAGDVMGTLYVEGKGPYAGAMILDLTESPQYSVDAGYEATGSAKTWNIIQTVLDYVGFIPVIGDIVDVVNALIYYLRGKYLEAALSVIAIILIVGSFIKFGVKGSMKLWKQSLKTMGRKAVSNFNKIGTKLTARMAKKLFTKGPGGEKAAMDLIEELMEKGILTEEKLMSINPDKLKSFFTKKGSKAADVMDKYAKAGKDSNINNALDAWRNCGENVTTALAKKKQQLKGMYDIEFGPLARMSGKDAIKATIKPGIITKGLGGFMKKISLNAGLVRRFQNLTKIPKSRKALIDKWMFEHVYDKLVSDPKLMRKFIEEMGGRTGKNFGKTMKVKPSPEVLRKLLKDKKSIVLKQLYADPDVYFGALWKKGLQGEMTSPSGLLNVMTSAFGVKTYDILYNEISEVIYREGGADIGGYGDEQQSVIAALIFKGFCDAEKTYQL